jgi:preprotein translocase subunit SecE
MYTSINGALIIIIVVVVVVIIIIIINYGMSTLFETLVAYSFLMTLS